MLRIVLNINVLNEVNYYNRRIRKYQLESVFSNIFDTELVYEQTCYPLVSLVGNVRRSGDWALSKSVPVHIGKSLEEMVAQEERILREKVAVKRSTNTGTSVKFGKGDVVYYKAHHLSKARKSFNAKFAPK